MIDRQRYNPNSYNALDSALAFICLLALFFVIENVFSSIVPNIADRSEDFDYYLYSCISIVVTQAAVIGTAFLFSRIKRVDLFSGGGFVYKFDGVGIMFALLLTSGLFFLLGPVHLEFTENVFDVTYGYSYDAYIEALEDIYKGDNFYLFLELFVLTPLLPAFCEEAMFRGVVMRGLRQFGVFASVILSSLCFMLMHGNPGQVVLQFCIGLAIGAVVTLTGNFFIGAAMHFSNNLFNVLYAVTENEIAFVTEGGEKLFGAITSVLGIVFVIVGGYYFIRLALKNAERKATGAPREITLKERETKAKIRREGEDWQYFYPVQIDFAALSDGTFFYEKNGVEKRINKRSGGVLSGILLGVGITLSIIMIFTY